MILLVPLNPEVPQLLKPKVWPSVVMVCCLLLGYLLTRDITRADNEYVQSVETSLVMRPSNSDHVDQETENYLALRPLLRIAPAQGDWDIDRLIKANFIHGSSTHLLLNMIGVFAGVRICMTFIPFLTAFAIFLMGGSLGLWVSLITSKQISDFIPHVGASAGLFALMGSYYIFNFKFRTQYFFWLPIRRGFVCLKTSWFFFIDVILLELVLSAAQLFPDRIDSIDHIAHVVGFSAGIFLALGLRLISNWPAFLQTRSEYIYWHSFGKKISRQKHHKIQVWLELLQINRYNDFLKRRLCNSIRRSPEELSDVELNEVFKFLVPTFVRLNTETVAKVIKTLISSNIPIPKRWLSRVPYDILIRIAKAMASSSKDQQYLYKFLMEYKKAQEPNKKGNSNVEKLMSRLELELKGIEQSSGQKAG
jgi:membrane associated rhomboid family serine protease